MRVPDKQIVIRILPGGNVEAADSRTRALAWRRMAAMDMPAARTYFRGVRALACEAASTTDVRVLRTALDVMKMQPATVTRLMGAQ